MKRALLILCFSLMFCQLHGGTKRALTVFIGDYPKESGWNKIASLNDKDLILAMLADNGFASDNIKCICNEQATYKSVVEALAALSLIAGPGDQIYIHFSSHGQLITDQDRDESLIDPKDKYDEAIVPYDAAVAYGWNGYTGEKHLIDDELNGYLRKISAAVGKRGSVLLIVDACHSGGIERGEDGISDSPYRGIMDAFDAPYKGSVHRPVAEDVSWCSISACKSIQTNFEVEIDGVRYGRLSYAMSRCFASGISAEDLSKRLVLEYKRLPQPRRVQEVSCVIPQSLKQKSLFK